MTEVAFHFNASDKVAYACRLLRKAYAKGSSLFVLADPGMARQLETNLWTLAPGSFIPHCLSDAPVHVVERTPIQIGSQLAIARPVPMLLNLQQEWVDGWQQFERIFEVVAQDDRDRQAARDRLRRYRAQGADPVWHDIQAV